MTSVPGPVPGDVFVATDGTRFPCTDTTAGGCAWVYDPRQGCTLALELGVDDVPALGTWVDGHPAARDPRPGDRFTRGTWTGVVRRRLRDRVELDVKGVSCVVTWDLETWWGYGYAEDAVYERPAAPEMDDAGPWANTPYTEGPWPPGDPTDMTATHRSARP